MNLIFQLSNDPYVSFLDHITHQVIYDLGKMLKWIWPIRGTSVVNWWSYLKWHAVFDLFKDNFRWLTYFLRSLINLFRELNECLGIVIPGKELTQNFHVLDQT